MKQRKIPQRMCVGCQQMKSKRALIRIVRTPEGEILIDEGGKKAGRGAYLCPDVSCLKAAVKGKRIQKALETNVPETVWSELETKLASLPPRAPDEEVDT